MDLDLDVSFGFFKVKLDLTPTFDECFLCTLKYCAFCVAYKYTYTTFDVTCGRKCGVNNLLDFMEKYIKVEAIGKGTFGIVYLVRSCENKK